MKILWSMIFTIVVLSIAVPVMLKRIGPEEDAEPNPAGSWLKGLPGMGEGGDVEEQAVQSGTIYRWRDANGTLHLESKPPPSGVQFDTIDYTHRVEPPVSESGSETAAEDGKGTLSSSPVSVYTPEGITELMERVDETAKRMNERDQLLNELEGEL